MERASESQDVPIKYEWQRAYLTALVETDEVQLGIAIDLAMKMITERQKTILCSNSIDHAEMQAIADAFASLRDLKKDASTNKT
jgi:tRNA(Arg) A34 adenosine deaminase TadA